MKLALRPTAPARERYHANPRPARRGNAPLRQRGRLRGQCSAERLTARAVRPGSGERASELGEDRQVGMEPDPIRATNAKRCQRPFYASCGDRALKLGLVGEER